jgi:hypothetical protein
VTSTVAPVITVATIAAIGAINAAKGIVVGSLPVTIVGPTTLAHVAADQITIVAPDSTIQNVRRPGSPRSRAIATNTTTDAANPHNQVPNAATGMRCCSLPWIMSGENTLMITTAVQIVATVASVQADHELPAGCDRAGAGGGQRRRVPGGGGVITAVSIRSSIARPYEATPAASSSRGRILDSTQGWRLRVRCNELRNRRIAEPDTILGAIEHQNGAGTLQVRLVPVRSSSLAP